MRMRNLVVTILTMAIIGGYLMLVHAEEPKESKESVYGNPTSGLAIAVKFTKPQYTLGREADFTVDIKNASETTMMVYRYNHYAQFRMALYDQDGHPVAKSKLVLEEDTKSRQSTGIRHFSATTGEHLAPGQTTRDTFILSNWFNVEKAGTYQLVVMRQLDISWDKGFAISNLAKIEITKPKE